MPPIYDLIFYKIHKKIAQYYFFKHIVHIRYTEKTGPEAGQYFHVRPPIGFIWMGYKTQEE